MCVLSLNFMVSLYLKAKEYKLHKNLIILLFNKNTRSNVSESEVRNLFVLLSTSSFPTTNHHSLLSVIRNFIENQENAISDICSAQRNENESDGIIVCKQ